MSQLKPAPHTQAEVSELPPCDFCTLDGRGQRQKLLAQYDFRTSSGQWANGCPRHFRMHSPTGRLGLGIGQQLVLKKES